MSDPRFTSVVITGASSGIGAALAAQYGGPGVTLGVTGRDAARLDAVAKQSAEAGAAVVQGVFDVRDRPALGGFLGDFDAKHPIGLLVANAGVLEGRQADGTLEDCETARRVIEINLLGAIDTVHAVLPGMTARGSGHIVLVSSLAGISPVADAPAYSASKAGLLGYGRRIACGAGADRRARVSRVPRLCRECDDKQPHRQAAGQDQRACGGAADRSGYRAQPRGDRLPANAVPAGDDHAVRSRGDQPGGYAGFAVPRRSGLNTGRPYPAMKKPRFGSASAAIVCARTKRGG